MIFFFSQRKDKIQTLGLDISGVFVLLLMLPLGIFIHLLVLCINYAFGMVTGVCCNLTLFTGSSTARFNLS